MTPEVQVCARPQKTVGVEVVVQHGQCLRKGSYDGEVLGVDCSLSLCPT